MSHRTAQFGEVKKASCCSTTRMSSSDSNGTPSPPAAQIKSWQAKGWKVESVRGSIMSSDQMDAAYDRLKIPVPEMIFGENRITVTHLASGWTISFNAMDALDLVDKTDQKMMQVSYSKVWQTARQKAGGMQGDVQGIVRPYDWTYTTEYRGTTGTIHGHLVEENGDIELPLELLKRPDPILFFDSLCLFEDELGDNGIVTLDVKIRVMPERLFILSRLFLRLDDVIFRVRDTRVLVELDKNVMIREYKEYEEAYDKVKKRVPAGVQDFGQFLRDENWVVGHLSEVKKVADAWSFGKVEGTS